MNRCTAQLIARAVEILAEPKWQKPKINLVKQLNRYVNSKDFFVEAYWSTLDFTIDRPELVEKYIGPEMFHRYGNRAAVWLIVKFTVQHRATERGGNGQTHVVDPRSIRVAYQWARGYDYTPDLKNTLREFFASEPWPQQDGQYGWESIYSQWVAFLDKIEIKPVPFRPGNNKTKQPLGPIGYVVIEQKERYSHAAMYQDRGLPDLAPPPEKDYKESVFRLRVYL